MDSDKKSGTETTEFVPETPSWAETEEKKEGWKYIPGPLGNLYGVPCAKETFMNSIIACLVSGVGYNLATSKSPKLFAWGVTTVVYFGTWISCRYNHRKKTIEANKLQHAMASYHYLEGTEESQKMDQEWLDKNDSEKRKRSKRIIQGTIPEEQ